MLRDPSLHITESNLIRVLSSVGINHKNIPALVKKIFDEAQDYQIRDRHLKILEMKSAQRKRAEKVLKVTSKITDSQVSTFNNLLASVRQKQSEFVKVRPILKDHKDYTILKEVAMNAYNFVTYFKIDDVRSGLTYYITIGLELMSKYSLSRFKYYDTSIYEAFEDRLLIANDETPENTLEFYELWRLAMQEYSTMPLYDLRNNMTEYAHFVRAKNFADKYNADYEDWLIGQFEGFLYLHTIPELTQLYGAGALTRYRKYVGTINIKKKEEKDDITKYYD